MNIIKTNLQYKEMTPRSLDVIDMLIFHHRAGNGTAESIHDIHLNEKGYAGAGYNWYIRKDGNVYELRDINYVPAAAQGSNTRSVNVCFEGNFNNEDMTAEQIKAGQELKKYILELLPQIKYIKGHRDVCSTSCPGANFRFDEIANGTIIEIPTTPVEGKIATIQRTVNERYGFNIAVDNIFGNETKTALVKALQIELNTQLNKGLAVDGKFGSKTKSACINVRKGAKGNITWLIQAMLVCKGYDISVDGDFGYDTDKALRDFQSKNGLTIDGICGKNTFEKLFR